MAAQAIMIVPSGERVLVYAKDLTDEERKNKFICAGITTKGELCGCQMKSSQPTPLHDPYFYESDSSEGHKPGCSCCRKRSTTDIEILDQSGERITTEKLYERITRKKVTARPPKKKGGDGGGEPAIHIPGEEDEGENQDDKEKKIRMKSRDPRTFLEYKNLLTNLSVHKKYAGQFVFDQILDQRTVAGYQRLGFIPTGRPFVITARKTFPREHGIHLTNDQWLLKDFWARGDNGFVFILDVSEEAKQLLWNLSNISPAVQIFIWTVFREYQSRPKTYISERVTPETILFEIANEPS